MISYDDFKKVELKVGKILSAEKIENTDKLLRLSVDFGFNEISVKEMEDDGIEKEIIKKEKDERQIISGIALYYPNPADLIGKKFVFCANLEPRKIKGFESNGMIMGIGGGDKPFSLLVPENPEIEEGSEIN